MIYEINISNQADIDLRNIYEYIAYEVKAPENAASQLTRLENNILGLTKMPERFRLYENEPWHSRGLHIMSVDHYLVLYIPDKSNQAVTILRVMYGGRDIEIQLAKYTK